MDLAPEVDRNIPSPRHEVLQRLEGAVAVQGAAIVERDTRSRPPEAFVLNVLLHPRQLCWRQMAPF